MTATGVCGSTHQKRGEQNYGREEESESSPQETSEEDFEG
jgi:hypothetical protein